MLNKWNLKVSEFASKEASRFTLHAIRVAPDATVATNGDYLAWVSTPTDRQASSFPAVDGFPTPSDDFKPFLLPSDAAKLVEKALPKKTTIPTLDSAAIAMNGDNPEEPKPVIAVTDLENPQVFRPHVPAGHFPNFDAVMPKWEDAKFRITLNASYLALIAKAFADFTKHSDTRGTMPVVLSFYDEQRAMRFDGHNTDTNQGMTCVLMPIRDNADKLNTYGYSERHAEENTTSAEAAA